MADSYDTAMDIDEPEAKRARVTPPPEAGPSGAAPLAAEVAHGAAPEVGAGDADVEGAATDDDDEVMMVGGRGESVGARASSAIPSTSLPPPTTSPDRLTDAASAAAPPIANGIPSGESSDDPASVGATGLVPVPSLNARSADGGKHEAFMMADGDGTTVYYPITSVSDSQPGSTAAIVPLPNGTVHAPALPNGHPTSEPPPAPSTSAGATGSTAAGLQAPSVPPVTNGSVAAPSDWRLTHTLRGHQKSLSAVAFSPNGKLLASTGADKLVLLWSFALPRPPASAPHINGSGSSKTAQMPTPAFIRSMKGHTAGLNDVAWAPDSRHFATCADDKTVRLWDASTGECRKTLQGHTHHVFCVAYSPTGGLLISGGWDETIRVWDAKRGTALRTIPAHSESVTSVGFSRDGSVFASGSFDGLMCALVCVALCLQLTLGARTAASGTPRVVDASRRLTPTTTIRPCAYSPRMMP